MRRLRLLSPALAALIPLLLLASAASAQPRQGPPDPHALELFHQGASAFREEKFELAIELFEQAWGITPDPLVAYNLAIAYGRTGELTTALRWADKATALGLNPEVALKNDARHRAFTLVLNARRIATTPRPIAAGPPTDPDPAPAPITSAASPGAWIGWVGLGNTVLGASLLTGAWFVSSGLDEDIRDYESAARAGNAVLYDERRRTIEGNQRLGRALLYGGAATLGVGVGLILWRLSADDAPPQATLQLTPTFEGAAAIFTLFTP